jgi:hypoxanthine-guanine phosphoribosyltransferase
VAEFILSLMTVFVGFSVGDLSVVVYGTDFAEEYRDLLYIGVVE